MKQGVLFMRSLLAVIILSLAISPTGGAAGSTVGHGKLGAAAGCVVGHYEPNKADAEKTPPQTPGQSTK